MDNGIDDDLEHNKIEMKETLGENLSLINNNDNNNVSERIEVMRTRAYPPEQEIKVEDKFRVKSD